MDCLTVVDVAKILAAVFAGAGLYFDAQQIRKATRQRRIEQVSALYLRLFDDPELRDMYYKIEYGEFKYYDGFHRSAEEPPLDRLLGHFDSVARLRRANLLTLEDLDLVAYEYLVIYGNAEVQRYISFLDGEFKEQEIPRAAYEDFQKVGKELKERMARKES